MIKLSIVRSADKVVAALEQHPDFKSAAVVTFTDGSRALVSTSIDKGYFTADADGKNLTPNFISTENTLMPGYAEQPLNGVPWITREMKGGGIKLP